MRLYVEAAGRTVPRRCRHSAWGGAGQLLVSSLLVPGPCGCVVALVALVCIVLLRARPSGRAPWDGSWGALLLSMLTASGSALALDNSLDSVASVL